MELQRNIFTQIQTIYNDYSIFNTITRTDKCLGLGLNPSVEDRIADAGAHGDQMTDAKNEVVFLD